MTSDCCPRDARHLRHMQPVSSIIGGHPGGWSVTGLSAGISRVNCRRGRPAANVIGQILESQNVHECGKLIASRGSTGYLERSIGVVTANSEFRIPNPQRIGNRSGDGSGTNGWTTAEPTLVKVSPEPLAVRGRCPRPSGAWRFSPARVFQLERPDSPRRHCPRVPPLTMFGPESSPHREYRDPKIVRDGTSGEALRDSATPTGASRKNVQVGGGLVTA